MRRRLADGAPKGSLLLFGPVHAPAWLWPSWSTSARWELAEPAAENGLNESSTGCSPNGRGGLPALRAPPSEIAAAAAAAAATLGGQKPSNDTDLRRGCPDSFSSIALHSRTEPSFQPVEQSVWRACNLHAKSSLTGLECTVRESPAVFVRKSRVVTTRAGTYFLGRFRFW